jgi:hypothetical protein
LPYEYWLSNNEILIGISTGFYNNYYAGFIDHKNKIEGWKGQYFKLRIK